MTTAKDLNKESPSSPRVRLAGYAILARALDKGRAHLIGNAGGYHFDCPLDNYLFNFKEVVADDVKKLLESGLSNNEIAAWLDANGVARTQAEKDAWSDGMEAARPYHIPEQKDWFIGACAEARIDPAVSTLFDYLEADDIVSFTA
jgi:hypothetical protein